MSRIQFVRQMLPRICKDFYELEIYHNPTGAATFDPGLTTSVSTTVIWQTEVGTTVTTGTNHAISYTPTAGAKVCKVTVVSGLDKILSIDANTDALVGITNINKMSALGTLVVYGNNDLIKICLPPALHSFTASSDPNFAISLGEIPPTCEHVVLTSCPKITGNLADLRSNYIDLYLASCSLVRGSVTDIKASCVNAFITNDTITAGSIAHLVNALILGFGSVKTWSSADVDTVLLSVSDAIWDDPNHFLATSPIALTISGSSGEPSGSIVDPLVTPGAGNSDANWQWNAGVGKHKALTGKAAIWYATTAPGKGWEILYTDASTTKTYNLVFEGDSLTATNYYPPCVALFLELASTGRKYNVALSGDTIAAMLGEAASQVDAKYDASYTHNVAVLWAGANDLARSAVDVYADIETWCTARQAAGWEVVVLSITRRTGAYDANGIAVSDLLRADHSFADAFVDVGGAALLQDPTDTAYFIDGLHLTFAASQQIVAPMVAAAIQGL